MFIRSLADRPQFVAGDRTHLREILNGPEDGLALRYSLAHAVVHVGEASVPHTLVGSEVYVVIHGEGRMHIGDEHAEVRAGDSFYVPPGARQWIENTGRTDLVFYCIVDPAWRPEDESIDESIDESVE